MALREQADDGDALDALALVSEPTFPGCWVRIRPVGLFIMEDQGKEDLKILGVPLGDPVWREAETLDDIPPHLLLELEHFFTIYKDLEGKRLAVGSRDSTQARILPLHYLRASGVNLKKVKLLAFDTDVGKHGDTGTSELAVLNANYLRATLGETWNVAFDRTCMHEVVINDKHLKDTGVTTLDVAKRLIDYGYHPPTVYFPLVVKGAMLVEPTETESKDGLDRYVEVVKGLAKRAKAGDAAYFKGAPYHTPRRRLDETLAARQPVLRWKPEPPKKAAE